ncbi:uncharacterized protein LOC132717701 [Ruditapes philippinarum]|uniref:uncharacterized protein LOC132717701 n=1 Tax=Ruditapes philippinarum TaxID=129788 RepID=UPI00295ABD28|nr:uncharacterized protein LOC132717701 [Ruditapes philippinarum]
MEVSGKKKDPTKGNSKYAAGVNAHIYCDPCNKDGIRLTAHGFCQDCMEHLCESCYKTHRKPAPCRNHVLLDTSQMPKTQSSGHLQAPHDLTEQCQLHKGKLIEYICHDHNTFGCSTCITLNHRNCKINYIPDVSKKYRTSDEYRELLRSLAALQKQFKTLIENTKANKKKILKNKYLVKDEIKKFRQEINIMFDKLEASLQKNADDIFAKESARMESLASSSVKLKKDIEQLQNDISKLEMANQCNALYILSKENKEIIQSYTSAEKQTHKDNYVHSFVFTPNVNLKEILGSKAGIGELHKSDIVRNVKTDADYFETLHVTYSDEIDVKSLSDKRDCCIPGAVFIAKHRIAVLDSTNRALKIVDTKTKKITCEKKLSESPDNLDSLPNDLFAVTFSCKEMITFLSIPNGLSEVRSLKVDGKCKDLVYHDNKIIVTFEWPGKVQIMNLYGHVYHSVERDFYGNELKCPCVAVDVEKNFYISDWNAWTVTRMNLDGEVLNGFKDERLVKPCEMVVLDDRSILVCSSGNHIIFLISENLEKGRVLLEKKDGLLCPWSLALDKVNKLYVGSGGACNLLKVYDLK